MVCTLIVPAYADSTRDVRDGEQSYHYYNEFLWPDRYADCAHGQGAGAAQKVRCLQ